MMSNFCSRVCFGLLGLFLFPTLVTSQSLPLHQLGTAEGLSSSFNMHFNIGRDGCLWTSSKDGLHRFDGLETEIFHPTYDGSSISPNITSQTFTDEMGRIWFTSTTSLHYLMPKSDSIASIRIPNQEPAYYYTFHLERDTFLWTVINKELYVFNIYEEITQQKPIGQLNTYIAYAIENTHQEVVKIASPVTGGAGGIELIELSDRRLNRRDTLFEGTQKAPNRIWTLHATSEDELWIPTPSGLIHLKGDHPPDTLKNQSGYDAGFLSIAPWKNGLFWVGTYRDGLFLFDSENKTFQKINLTDAHHQPIELKRIERILMDDNQNLWLSVLNQGFYYTNPNNLKFWSIEAPFELIIPEEMGPTPEFGFSPFPVGQRGNAGILNIKKKPNAFLIRDQQHQIWQIAKGNVARYNKQSQAFETVANDLDYPFQIETINEQKFALLQRGGMLILDKKNSTTLDTILNLVIDQPARLFYSRDNQTLLVSQTNTNLLVIDLLDEKMAVDTIIGAGLVRGYSDSKVDNQGWLASSTGLFEFNFKQGKVFRRAAGKIKQALIGVEEDDYGRLWLSSYNGILLFNPLSKDSVQFFTESDGLHSMKYFANNNFKDSRGRIYFNGHQKKVIIVDPKRFSPNENSPQISFVNFRVNNNTRPPFDLNTQDTPYKLEPWNRNLFFQFSVVEFSDPSLNQFEYHLIKNGKDTVSTGTNNPIRFTPLNHGNYKLIVNASNSDGIKLATPKSLYFKVKPYYYETWIFKGFIAMLALVAVLWIFRNTKRKHREKLERTKEHERLKRETAESKQKEAEAKRQIAENENAILRLQMNPHFIFNSLNSINSYILKNDRESASKYLDSFAKLMRQTLERSEESLANISEEVEFLELYMKTEQMRMSHPLDYSFEIDEKIDQNEVLIPTMVLQPFLENAIWHGIAPKKDAGKITTRFMLKEEQLICEVEDNGIGFQASNGSKTTDHKSKAMKITRKRLKNLPEDAKNISSLKITDLSRAANGQGTKVQLIMPVITD